MDVITQLKELIPPATKWVKNNVITIIFIAFSILKFGWLDDIEKQHYFLGDIDKIQDDSFYSIIIFEVVILIILMVWQLRSFNPLKYILAGFLSAIPAFFMFLVFQELYMAILLPLNRTEVKAYEYDQYWITYIEQVEHNGRQEHLINVKSVDKEYRTRGYFIVSESDIANYQERDTITLRFSVGKFDLRFDPSNDKETFTFYKN